MMSERGLKISHTTIMRGVHEFEPEIDKRIRPYLKPTNDSYRTDETYIKVKGQWKYWHSKCPTCWTVAIFFNSCNTTA